MFTSNDSDFWICCIRLKLLLSKEEPRSVVLAMLVLSQVSYCASDSSSDDSEELSSVSAGGLPCGKGGPVPGVLRPPARQQEEIEHLGL